MTSVGLFVAGVITTAIGGIALAVQTGVNSTLGRHVGRGLASVVSFIVGLILLILYFAFEVYAAKAMEFPSFQQVKEVPWWAWTGGAQGAWYVLNVVIFAQPLGAATLTAVNVTASLAGAMVLDATGWIGFTKRSVQWQRVLGLLLMVVGVVLVSVYRGHEEEVAEVQLQLPGQPQLPPGPSVDLVVQSGSPLQAQAAPK